jgi:hypothetical protein
MNQLHAVGGPDEELPPRRAIGQEAAKFYEMQVYLSAS